MEFGLLGPLAVTEGDRPVPIPSPKQRTLLAALLLRAGALVTEDELADAIWGDDLPAHPRRAVQIYVTRLRKLLGTGLLQRRNEGYVLTVARGDIDLGRFELLLEQARHAAGAGDRHREAAALRQALGLWRGEPLADVPSETLHREAARLTERRLDALHRRIEADLALGRHAELVSELRVLTEADPLREGLWAQLMLALYRCGRQADALQAFASARDRLVEDLGIEPGPELQRLQRAILTGDPALASAQTRPAALATPSQLPVDVADFVGRTALVEQVAALLADRRRVPIVAVSGSPGVGKTALAVHAAHRLAARFPDGQLYVDLHGATAGLAPLTPLEVLGRFLRALGADPATIPADLEEASAVFRSRVAGRRLLVVADNAADAAQVVPLLPASVGCGVLVTSRRVLTSLDGAVHLRLEALATGEALELLGQVAGGERVAAEPEAAAELAGWCGRLPLALRIAGARLAARPAWPVEALAERLADAQGRLDELELAEVGVRASFQVSYQQLAGSPEALDRAAAGAFVLLGVLDSPEVAVPVVARLLDAAEDAAEQALERLVDAHLLETPWPRRYRLHDLLQLYARELADHQHPERERAAALSRALRFYVATSWRTMALLRPADHRLALVEARWNKDGLEFADDQAALTWLEAERANLLAVVRQASTTPGGPVAELAIQLAQALAGYFFVRNYWDDWARVNRTALGVACRVGDRAAQAQAYNDLGLAQWRRGRHDRALACHRQSLAIRRELGDRRGEAASLNNLALVYEWQGRYDQAVAHLQAGMVIWRELDNRHGMANTLGNLGNCYERQGRYDDALACQQESLAAYRELDYPDGLARGLNNLGRGYERQGRYGEALVCQQEGLAIYRELGDRDGQAFCLHELGVLHRRQGRYELALACQQESLALRRELGDPYCQAESLRAVGVTLRALGRPQEARAHWRQALMILDRLQSGDADRR